MRTVKQQRLSHAIFPWVHPLLVPDGSVTDIAVLVVVLLVEMVADVPLPGASQSSHAPARQPSSRRWGSTLTGE